MNAKHLACAVVFLLIVCMAQGSIWMNKRMVQVQKSAMAARTKLNNSEVELQRSRFQLNELATSSKPLVEYLKLWQPYFDDVASPQGAELKISLRIKESDLVNLSQRFEVVPYKLNRSVAHVMRAQVTFDDDYARLLNWLGKLEADLPTMRIASLQLSKGTGPTDLKMELTLEQPLLSKQ